MNNLGVGGVHHMVLVCKDLKTTHEFYTNVMKMRLTAAIHVPPMPEEEAIHLFYDMGGGNQLAFFWFRDAPAALAEQAHPANVAAVSAHGSMHHVAFRVDDEEAVLNWREHLKASGVKVTPMIDHEFCKSIYFEDPDGVQLEISYWVRVLDERDISDRVLAQAGIRLEAPALA
jgi:catechol 2,3-dioxygenase-like lactoylglutathione lyase family enzyme